MNNNNKMGLWMATALVAGNMIGSGIFLLPASLASIGSISLYGWIFTAGGAFALAILFAKMSLWIPKAGGPYACAKVVFGDYMGFQTAYSYWIAIWVGNAAIAIAFVGYLQVFFPLLANPWLSCVVAIIEIWLLTLINIRGAKTVGGLQLVTTIGKLVPILLIVMMGWFFFHPHYLTARFNVSHHHNITAISSAASLTLWAFIGVESAAVSSGAVNHPDRNVPLATLLGTVIAAFVYIASSIAIMGMIPNHVLASSTAPFALAASKILGPWGSYLMAAGAAISCFGSLNGWILLQGQIPMNAAQDKLFPLLFAKCNRYDIPAIGLVITSALVTILLLLTVSKTLTKQFELIILIAVLANLLPYLYTAIAALITIKKHALPSTKASFYFIIAVIAIIYSLWAILGCGKTILGLGVIFLLTTIPLYLRLKATHKVVSGR